MPLSLSLSVGIHLASLSKAAFSEAALKGRKGLIGLAKLSLQHEAMMPGYTQSEPFASV